MAHSAEEAVRMNVRATVGRITELADQSRADLVFVCGEVRSRSDVLSELPHRIAARVVSLPARAEGGRAHENEVADLIDDEFARRHRDAVGMVVARYQAETGRRSNLAVQGLPAVCTALRDGAVDTLIISDPRQRDRRVRRRSDHGGGGRGRAVDVRGGAAPGRPGRSGLPFVAIAPDASVVIAEHDLAIADGVAACCAIPRSSITGSARSSRPSVPS